MRSTIFGSFYASHYYCSGLVFPIGEPKHGYRLALEVVATTEKGNVALAVAEATVIPPRPQKVLDLVQNRIQG